MKKTLASLLSLLMISTSLFAQTGADKQTDDAKIISPGTNAGWVYSNGRLFRNTQGNSGLESPKNSNQYAIYAAGFWMGAMIDGEVHTSINEYYSTFIDGPIGESTSDSKWKLYDITSIEAKNPNSEKFKEWMAMKPYGAPTVFDNALGFERPDVKGDQNMWSVFNDMTDHGETGSKPLGAEVNQLVWGYARTDVLGDATFIKYVVKNKSGKTWNDTYFSLWSDPDLGDAGDDYVGSDTTLSLGYVYNVDDKKVLGKYAAGYDFLQGPVVPSPGDEANYNFSKLADHKNLPMTSFMTYENSRTSNWGDPHTAHEIYNYMQAKNKAGETAITYPNYPAGHTTNFLLTGDPESNTGWLDSNPGDRRLMMTTGPFTMKDGDEQEVVIGFLTARGTDNKNAVTQLKRADDLVQKAYDLNFDLAAPPAAPELGYGANSGSNYTPTVTKDDEGKISVTIAWKEGPEDFAVKDEFIKDYNEYFKTFIADTADSHYGDGTSADPLVKAKTIKFGGYLVYQYPNASRNVEERKLVGLYDDPATLGLMDKDGNVPQTYYGFATDAATGAVVYKPMLASQGNGLSKSIKLTSDAISGGPFQENKDYYFDVKTFAFNAWGSGIIESTADLLQFRIALPDKGVTTDTKVGTKIVMDKTGPSDGAAMAVVVDPYALTGGKYDITFKGLGWNVIRTLDGKVDTLVKDFKNQPSTGYETNPNFPIVDGLQFRVSGAPYAMKDFQVVANGAGAINPPQPGALWWQGFPGHDTDEYITDAQQVGKGHWAFHTWPNGNRGHYENGSENFVARTFRNGWADIVPNDFEMRFTATGGFAYRGFQDDVIVPVPFELWNVGDVNDPSDDYRMVPLIYDMDNDGVYDLVADGISNSDSSVPTDHEGSGGSDDPWTDPIYWYNPSDKTPGEAGYNAAINATAVDRSKIGHEVFARTVLVNWNGFDASTSTVNQALPETGTVFRLISTKPNTEAVTFSMVAPAAPKGASASNVTTLENVKVYPNPFYAHHNEISQALEKFVYFNNLPEKATIRIFTLAGELAKTIHYDRNTNGNKDNTYKYDLNNHNGLPLGSGLYIYHVEADGMSSKVGKFAVIMPEERLTVY